MSATQEPHPPTPNIPRGVLTRSQIRIPIQLLIATRARIRRVVGNNQAVRAERLAGVATEHVALDEHLVVGARVDRLVVEVDVEVVVDVLVAEAPRGPARAHVLPEVVVVADVQVAEIDVAESRVIADQRRLPVVVEVVPRDRDVVGAADDVDLAVLVVVSLRAARGWGVTMLT